ncbi:MAG: ATP synthase F1 subunit epsilon [Oscillospiraceae bacterium]|nr:ATP synthase F1 subunit epsilon [Oscillospiraceae bacterium]
MTSYPLTIVTPDGLIFDGEAQELIVRTLAGDVGIMAGHADYVAPLGMGLATVVTENGRRTAACIGGMVSVISGKVRLVPTTFEWSDKIDLKRAKAAKETAESGLQRDDIDEATFRYYEAKLKRALIRLSAAESNK